MYRQQALVAALSRPLFKETFMSRVLIQVTESVEAYLVDHAVKEAPILARLRAETSTLRNAGMQISALQGQLMALLVRLVSARRCLEVGTYTGYSALAVALSLPSDGRLIACDMNAEWTAIAERYWLEAGVADKVQLRLGPALATLDGLLAAGEAGRFDFAFIDADKVNYDGYYERCLKLLRQGGLVVIDNVLWSGKVADKQMIDPDTLAIKHLNDKVRDDARVFSTMLPIGDGVTLAIKLGASR
jgi:predicted O-methyltransferase YrrM